MYPTSKIKDLEYFRTQNRYLSLLNLFQVCVSSRRDLRRFLRRAGRQVNHGRCPSPHAIFRSHAQDQEGKQSSCAMSTLLQECDISGADWSMTKQIEWKSKNASPAPSRVREAGEAITRQRARWNAVPVESQWLGPPTGCVCGLLVSMNRLAGDNGEFVGTGL